MNRSSAEHAAIGKNSAAEAPPLPFVLAQMMADGESPRYVAWLFEEVLPAIFYTGGYVLNRSKTQAYVDNLHDLPIDGAAFSRTTWRLAHPERMEDLAVSDI